MKKLGIFVMPLMAVSLLASCGGNKEPTKVSYTLTYTYDNGTTNKYVETYTEDKKTEKPTWVPENPGNTFEGWFTESGEEGTQFTFGNVLTNNTVVYAHWSKTPEPKTTYHLTFKGTHCKMDGDDTYEEDIPIGATTQRKIYPDEGYALPVLGKGGLVIEGDGASSVSYEDGNIKISEFSGDVKITAESKVKDCIVSFNPNGGDLIGSPTVTVSYGTKFSAITDLASHKAEKNLCLFNGWALTSTDTEPLNAENDYVIKGNLEVYAILLPQYTVKLTFNGTYCNLYKNGTMQAGTIDIVSGKDNIFTIEPVKPYFPVFLTPVTSTNTVKCEFDSATKQLTVCANQNCTVTASTTKQTLEECTWSEINSISEAGFADEFFDVGDLKKVRVNEKDHNVRIIGFNHDALKSDKTKTAGITFEFANVITNSDGSTDNTYWNHKNGDSSTNYKYSESTLNDHLNKDDNCVFDKLPDELKADGIIKEVYKPVAEGSDYEISDTYTTKLFPLSYREITAKGTSSFAKEEGFAYPFYTGDDYDTDDNRIKRKAGIETGTGEYYWLRSPNTYDNYYAWDVMEGDLYDYGYEVYLYEFTIAPAFCI